MTLIKSVLLGSAAGIVAVAGAQAADLPTHKAAPVAQYVKICDVGGITGWVLPGSDTCVKLSGYITAQFVGGSLSNQYNWGGGMASGVSGLALNPGMSDQSLLVEGTNAAVPIYNAVTGKSLGMLTPGYYQNGIGNRNAIGWSTRANFGFDFASNTAYGPLIGHMDFNVDVANGLDPLQGGAPTPNIAYLNTGYLTWAGITAGKAASFFSFVGGGDNYANIFSPDRKGFNQPLLLAYTASFGGGFSATISAESQGTIGASGAGTNLTGYYFNTNTGSFGPDTGLTFGGQRWPDIVGALHVKQAWGEAQLSGVIHNVNMYNSIYNGGAGCGLTGLAACDGSESKVGFALDAGVKFNLPWNPGDTFLLTGAYSQNATWYSGLADGMWTENGQVNGNGQPMFLADGFFNPMTNQWSTPRAWSVAAILEHHWSPTFYTNLEASIGGISWSGQNGYFCPTLATCAGTGALSPNALSWIIGADFGWNPVTNLNFDLELMYQSTTQDAPSGYQGTVYSNGAFVPGVAGWEGNSSGFAGRLRITRYF